jgi:hypothetical protein
MACHGGIRHQRGDGGRAAAPAQVGVPPLRLAHHARRDRTAVYPTLRMACHPRVPCYSGLITVNPEQHEQALYPQLTGLHPGYVCPRYGEFAVRVRPE